MRQLSRCHRVLVAVAAAAAWCGTVVAQPPACAGACPVNIQGLTAPVSVTWDNEGFVYIAEKAGVVKSLQGTWVGAPSAIVLDITGEVYSYGDHGLTSILYNGGYLYATYMKQGVWGATGCDDYGQNPGVRPWSAMVGCYDYGRVSRWPITAGAVSGPEQVLLDTQLPDANGMDACVEFSTHSTPTCIIASNDGAFYVAFGDGAAFTAPDFGQMGTSATENQGGCDDNSPYLGAFRAQDPKRFNGKVIRLDPANNWAYSVMSTGHRNPFRLSLYNDILLESETGWYTWEEINVITPGKNYGWPCWEGPIHTPEYDWTTGPGLAICSNFEMQLPAYSYDHPVPPIIQWSGNVMSISGVAGLGDRVYYNDMTVGVIHSLDAATYGANGDNQLEASNVYPVELKVNPAGYLIFVDYRYGYIQALDLGSPIAPSPPAGAAAAVTLVASEASWTPGTTAGIATEAATDLAASREGVTFTYTASLLTNCGAVGPQQTCDSTVLFTNTAGSTNFTMDSPPVAGVVELTVDVNLAGAPAAASNTIQIPSDGSEVCPCAGTRATVPLPSPGSGTVPGLSPTVAGGTAGPGASPSRKNTSSVGGQAASSGINTSSAAFVAPVTIAAALVGIGAVAAALYATGVVRRPSNGGGPTGGVRGRAQLASGGRVAAAGVAVAAAGAAGAQRPAASQQGGAGQQVGRSALGTSAAVGLGAAESTAAGSTGSSSSPTPGQGLADRRGGKPPSQLQGLQGNGAGFAAGGGATAPSRGSPVVRAGGGAASGAAGREVEAPPTPDKKPGNTSARHRRTASRLSAM